MDLKTIYAKAKEYTFPKKELIIVFVYNDYGNSKIDMAHQSECITSHELAMINNSFLSITDNYLAINGEDEFIAGINDLKQKYRIILVYSMAQNITGYGRRGLVPLLCDYYGFHIINADFWTSVLSVNKHLMQDILCNNGCDFFPETYWIKERENINIVDALPLHTKYIIKPNSESASIGVEIIEIHDRILCKKKLDIYYKHYGEFMLQKYIAGKEIEVSIFKFDDQYYAAPPVEILFANGSEYLTAETILSENYNFKIYNGDFEDSIIEAAIKSAQILGFRGISRYDFRVNKNGFYLFDITANPTISEFSSTNYSFKYLLGSVNSVYELLTYDAMYRNNLLVPPLHDAK